MTRLGIIFIAVCALAGALFYFWQTEQDMEAKKRELEARGLNARGKVVYAVEEIRQGSVISAAALEEREIEQSKIPQDAISFSANAVGRRAYYGISLGQIVAGHDLDPDPHRRRRTSVRDSKMAHKKSDRPPLSTSFRTIEH